MHAVAAWSKLKDQDLPKATSRPASCRSRHNGRTSLRSMCVIAASVSSQRVGSLLKGGQQNASRMTTAGVPFSAWAILSTARFRRFIRFEASGGVTRVVVRSVVSGGLQTRTLRIVAVSWQKRTREGRGDTFAKVSRSFIGEGGWCKVWWFCVRVLFFVTSRG